MIKSSVYLGSYFASIGLLLPSLAEELKLVTFRGNISAWLNISPFLAIVGAALIILGLLGRQKSNLEAVKIAKYFGTTALVNIVAAIAFISPILLPNLEFPILITRWPGIYMVAAYLSFLVVGVLGFAGWALLYYLSPKILMRDEFDKWSVAIQFILTLIGIYGMAAFMFWGGYIGSVLADEGAGDTLVGTVMESSVIPSAVFIYTLMYASLCGVVNLLTAQKKTPSTILQQDSVRS